jgi:hypothetical protein
VLVVIKAGLRIIELSVHENYDLIEQLTTEEV